MNRTLTAAVALVASTAGAAGLSGTATADPAPEFPAAPTVHHDIDNWMGTLRTSMQSVGHVVPAAERAAGDSADDRTDLPLIDQIRSATPASLVTTVGDLTGKSADTQGVPDPAQQSDWQNRSSVGGDSSDGSHGLPGTDTLSRLAGGDSALGGLAPNKKAMAVDPIATVRMLTGDLPMAENLPKINALGHD